MFVVFVWHSFVFFVFAKEKPHCKLIEGYGLFVVTKSQINGSIEIDLQNFVLVIFNSKKKKERSGSPDEVDNALIKVRLPHVRL